MRSTVEAVTIGDVKVRRYDDGSYAVEPVDQAAMTLHVTHLFPGPNGANLGISVVNIGWDRSSTGAMG